MSMGSSVSPVPYDPLSRQAQEDAMSWYGWGSPVGVAIALVGVGIAAVLFRFAWLGF